LDSPEKSMGVGSIAGIRKVRYEGSSFP